MIVMLTFQILSKRISSTVNSKAYLTQFQRRSRESQAELLQTQIHMHVPVLRPQTIDTQYYATYAQTEAQTSRRIKESMVA
jgi:hypothetical protein